METIDKTRPGLFTRAQAAQYLQIGEWKLDELIRRGRIASVRVGRAVRIAPSACDRFIEQGGDK